MHKSSILLIYTGGTIGMIEDAATHQLMPFNFNHLYVQIPELKKFDLKLSVVAFDKPLDSSNMNIEIWKKITKLIEDNYDKYDGFVILMGSDTMAYTASALSFMLENLNKPVILTGSQLPIGKIRTDGKENLITALEIASSTREGKPVVPEVAIYFEYQLYRGNRTHKYNSEHFEAFESPNYPVLAEAGVHIHYNHTAITKYSAKKLKAHYTLDNNIAFLKLFPGINENVVNTLLTTNGLRAVILETFGSGNAPTDSWFVNAISHAIGKGIIVLNITQCNSGRVEQGRYETSAYLKNIGVVGGADLTAEAAVTKLMFLLGQKMSVNEIKKNLQKSLRGELTE